jgi:lipoate---protein ligase
VGALPRARLLSSSRERVRQLFDPDTLRPLSRRTAFVRRSEHPVLVLGSTQSAAIASQAALHAEDVELVRRRSGGGAVLVEPGRCVWIDTWVPRGDPLWDDDVSRSRAWVGEWWAAAIGVPRLRVHAGRPVATRWSELICFAGLDVGEVVDGERKVVGVAQWRTRQGALTHAFAYLETAWPRLTALLLSEPEAGEAAAELARSTVAVTELAETTADALVANLVAGLPGPQDWDLQTD